MRSIGSLAWPRAGDRGHAERLRPGGGRPLEVPLVPRSDDPLLSGILAPVAKRCSRSHLTKFSWPGPSGRWSGCTGPALPAGVPRWTGFSSFPAPLTTTRQGMVLLRTSSPRSIPPSGDPSSNKCGYGAFHNNQVSRSAEGSPRSSPGAGDGPTVPPRLLRGDGSRKSFKRGYRTHHRPDAGPRTAVCMRHWLVG